MATKLETLRTQLRERIAADESSFPQLEKLVEWACELPDQDAAEGLELAAIALDAGSRIRWRVVRVINEDLRRAGSLPVYEERVAFLRWIVNNRETDGRITAKLAELRSAEDPAARAAIFAAMAASQIPSDASIDRAHSILAQAWRAAPPDARPTGPVHRGELTPFIGAKNTVRLVITFARRVAHLVPRGQKKEFERLLALAEASLEEATVPPALRKAIAEADTEGAMGLARSACVEANVRIIRPDSAGSGARPAVVKAVALLLEADGKEAVRSFLADIDEEMLRLDVLYMIDHRKKTPSKPIRRAVYRGAEGRKIVLWLAELEDGRLGLLAKQGKRWAWTEGTRDEILPLVPDAHFERAVNAASAPAYAPHLH